jgi:TldD protein
MGREHPFAKIQGAQGSQDESTKKAKLTTGELQERLKNWDAVIQKKYPEVKNRSLTLRQQNFIKEGLNSEGASTAMHFARSHVYIQLGMDSSSGPVAMMDVLGGMGEIEDTWFSDELFLERIEEQIRHLKNKANGIRPEAGRHTVILASDLAGILAHEAVGHTTEADLVKGGSVAREALGKVVASPLVSLVDFAHTALGKKVPAPVYFDDEGVTAKDTTIIDQGVLKSWMHNKETAAEFGVEATGHARAWAFNDEPLIRMRNTAILPGQSRLQDMIASIDDGYFLMNSGNGQADSTSEFMFAVTMGYEIKKGKLGRALLDTTVSGVAFDMLKTVSMVSTEFEWEDAGTCGKKQPMFVGMGGPAIKCEIALGGQ